MNGGCSPLHRAYLTRLRNRARLVTALRIAVLLAVIAVWELGARLGLFDAFILSCPSRVVATAVRLFRAGELFRHIGATLWETVAGFFLGTAAGILIAAALWWAPLLERVLDPYLVVLNALPKIALGPVLIVWIGAGRASIIVMAVLISFVVTAVSVLGGFAATTADKQLLMRTLGAKKLQIFFKIVLPASVPDMITALKISVGMSWVGVIVGEYLVSREGLGYLIVYGGQVFQLDLVMTSVVILCILAAGMYELLALLEKRVRR